MSNTQALKRRIRSVGNTKQITKAMELVSAAKMRRVQEAAGKARLYSDAAIDILRRLASSVEAAHHPFFQPQTSKSKLYIIISSDSGLAGAYNANIFNFAAKNIASDKSQGLQPVVIAYGRKAAHHFSRASNVRLLGEYENVADDPDVNVFAPTLAAMTSGVINGEFGAVELIYTEFQSSLKQQVVGLPLIPIADLSETASQDQDKTVFEFEPSVEAVLASALKLYFESALRRARVEAAASEHAMRMMSMNSANRNAGELIDNLTLELNATRQAAITAEMAEIIGGANAIA